MEDYKERCRSIPLQLNAVSADVHDVMLCDGDGDGDGVEMLATWCVGGIRNQE
jgi:hypothetical protein